MTEENDVRNKFTPDDKLQREVEKLTEEVRVLKKPYLQPTFWIGIIALGVSIAGNVGQALTYEHRKIIAEADVAQAKLDKIDIDQKRAAALADLESRQKELAEIKGLIATAKSTSTSSQVQQTLEQAEQKVNTIEQQTQVTSQSLTRPDPKITFTGRSRADEARDKEREGFEALISGDYDRSIAAFEAAEQAYNGYNNVYEIASLLRQSKDRMSIPDIKKGVFREISTRLAWGAPPDLIAKVKAIANQ